uniref:Type-F conjugative transfer system protein TraW N-terminal domain-containing protein n=7 Tax=Escherichia coli TaxID=562 RepID=A0A385EMZ2_ECOLX|nr:hypothetical protein GIDALANA_00086 [Escherichia coli]
MRCRGLIALLVWGQSVAAADLGTWGDLWPVKEPDMLTVIMQRLTALEQSGEMGRKMDAFKERVIRNSLRPPAVPGIGRTEKYSSRLFDPSVRLAADIRDNEGRVWGLNLSRHAHIRQLAINRLWGWAVFSQFWYYFAGFPWYEGNILFAFAVAAQVLTWCETRSGWRTAAAILMMALWGPLSGTSYGIAGLLMLAVSHRLYRAEDRMERLVLVACLLAVIPALNLATSDAAAVAGLVMTVLTVGLVSCAGKSLPRFWPGDFFPTFYACHLAVLGVLAL